MRRILKAPVALIIVLAMMLTFASAALAEAAPAAANPLYIPLGRAFNYAGGAAAWDEENFRISASYDEDAYIFYLHSDEASVNDEPFSLKFAIYVEDDRAYISCYDAAFLFSDESGYYSDTIMVAVYTTFYVMDTFSVPGITVALVDDETGFTWTQGFGYANEQAGIYVDEYTLFNLASISKTFTAVSVMQLAEKGLINLDEPIVTYLPQFSTLPDLPSGLGNYRNITVRMLLSHASGIFPDYMPSGVATINGYNKDYLNNFLSTMAGINMLTPEASAFQYSNNAFNLLGILVAAVSGADSFFDGFVDYTRENIFNPVGMDLTTFTLDDEHMPYLAQAYASTGSARSEYIYFNSLPAGGLLSNAHDMARFMHLLLGGGAYGGARILSESSVSQMLTKQVYNFASAIDFLAPNMRPGLGLLYRTGFDGYTNVGHGGDLVHYHSDMALDSGSGTGVFVSTNSITGMSVVSDLAVAILQNAVFEKTGTLNVPAHDSSVVPVQLAAEELQSLAGIYAISGLSAFTRITLEDDGILYMYDFSGIPSGLALLPVSDGSFLNPDYSLRFWFEKIDGELVIYYGEFKTHLLGAKLDPQNYAAPDSFNRWIGAYAAVAEHENDVSIINNVEVGIDDNGIAFIRTYAMHGLAPISPIIYIDDSSYYAGDIIRFETDGNGADLLSFSGAKFMKVS